MRTVELLARQLDEAFRMLHDRVEGLTDEEFTWAPVRDAWTVRRLPDGRWAADYEEPDPIPAPFTTIGWRVVHVAECKLMYHEYAFGSGRLSWDDLDSPHTASAAIEALEEGQRMLVADLDGLDDPGLEASVMTNWGERSPAWQVLWTMVHHDLWHGGEIGAMRDAYARRHAFGGEAPGSPRQPD